jgi:hypothetical protein
MIEGPDYDLALRLHLAADWTNDAADHDELHAAGAVLQLSWGLLAPRDREYIARWIEGLVARHELADGKQ